MAKFAIYDLVTGEVEEYREADNDAEAITKWEPGPSTHAAEEVPDDQPRVLPKCRRIGPDTYVDMFSLDDVDVEELNRALGQKGSVIRALAWVLFKGVAGQWPAGGVTKQQFFNYLRDFMRKDAADI